MIVAICVLVGLLLCSLFINACLWYAVKKLVNEYIESNPEEMVTFYLNKYTEEKLPCTLLLTENNNAEFDGSVYDFSQYEEKNIIGLIECKKGSAIDDDENEPRFALLPNQTVLRMKDGSYQWDFRGLM